MQDHPIVARYMTTFEASIAAIDPAERLAIAQEIRNHIAEATAAGRPLDDVLRSLGPADTLARAYAVELLLNPRSQRLESVLTFLKLASVAAVGSFATLIVVTMLASVGIGFTASGVVILAIGVLETSGIHLQGVQLSGIPPQSVIAIGPPLIAVGVGALVMMRSYIRFAARAMSKALPRRPAVA